MMNFKENILLQSIVLLRQRIDSRLDAECFRVVNGLECKSNVLDEVALMIKDSALAEMLKSE